MELKTKTYLSTACIVKEHGSLGRVTGGTGQRLHCCKMRLKLPTAEWRAGLEPWAVAAIPRLMGL